MIGSEGAVWPDRRRDREPRSQPDGASPHSRGDRADRAAQPRRPVRLSRPHRQGGGGRPGPPAPGLRQLRPWLRRLRHRQGRAARGRGAEPGHRHLLQRHAVGASALRALSGPDQAGGAGGRRHGPGGRRRAGDVRRRHPGRGGDGAVAVLARRHRPVDRGRPVAPDVRRRRVPRRLRQDRARPGDRRPVLRPSAGGVHPGRADALGPGERRQGQGPAALRRGQGRPRRRCWRPRPSPITGRAPAPSTAPPTPTRC